MPEPEPQKPLPKQTVPYGAKHQIIPLMRTWVEGLEVSTILSTREGIYETAILFMEPTDQRHTHIETKGTDVCCIVGRDTEEQEARQSHKEAVAEIEGGKRVFEDVTLDHLTGGGRSIRFPSMS